MKSHILTFAVFSLLIAACAHDDEGELLLGPIPNDRAELIDVRSFGTKGDARITFSRYINALYEDNLGRSATSSEIARARAAYNSGQGLAQVISSGPLGNALRNRSQEMEDNRGVTGGARGFHGGSSNDFLLLYFAFSDYYSPRYNFSSYYPYFYTSRSYIYDYLLYSYLLR